MDIPLLCFKDKNASRYVNINNNYSAYRLVDVLKSRGNPIIGHQISERISLFFENPRYKRTNDMHFQDFLEPLLHDINYMSFDTPPLKDLYLRVKEREHNLERQKNFDEYVYDMDRKLGRIGASDKIKRWQLLNLQCEHQLVRNARMI